LRKQCVREVQPGSGRGNRTACSGIGVDSLILGAIRIIIALFAPCSSRLQDVGREWRPTRTLDHSIDVPGHFFANPCSGKNANFPRFCIAGYQLNGVASIRAVRRYERKDCARPVPLGATNQHAPRAVWAWLQEQAFRAVHAKTRAQDRRSVDNEGIARANPSRQVAHACMLNGSRCSIDHHEPRRIARMGWFRGNTPLIKREVQQFGGESLRHRVRTPPSEERL
jgi:hypothetical protein